ncbi:MAG: hypothetical protein O3A93_09230 [Chloroflexi bacterium]|nr:hypothetical protein [Chloroflexota bacterium]
MEIAYGTADDNWNLETWVDTPTLVYGPNTTYGCGLAAYNAPDPPPAPSTPADAVVILAQDWSSRWGSVLAGPDSRWISVDERGRPGVAPLEEFSYVYEFTLAPGATNMALTMDIYADQQATISLNGNTIGTVPDWPLQASQGQTSVSNSDASYFLAGTNVLEVKVIETGAYPLAAGCGVVTGFNAVGRVSGLSPFVPEPPIGTVTPVASPFIPPATRTRLTPTPAATAFLPSTITSAVSPTGPPLTCPRGETEIQSIFYAGVNDNYDPNSDTPPANPSAGLSASITSPLMDFDQLDWDKWFAHTFVGLPDDIISAQLEIGLMPWGANTENDTIALRFTDSNGNLAGTAWTSRIGSPAGLLPQSWPLYDQYTFVLDLSQLPPQGVSLLADMNASGFLDVLVQDDTRVDYATLSVTVCGVPATPTPTPLSIFGTLVRPRTTPPPTQTPTPAPTVTPTPPRENPDLTTEKFLNSEFHYGQSASYTVQVSNVGQGSASSPITVVDDLPNGITFDSFSDPYSTDWACSASGQLVTCTYTGPPISPGGLLPTLIINVTVAPIDKFPGGSDAVVNCATVDHNDDRNSANNQGCVTTVITASG